jgi:Flp pilus assembly pilin Flp
MTGHTLIKQFARDQRGVAMIEFIMVLPFLFVLLFGGIEISRLILIQQKLEKAGYVMADMTTQYLPHDPADPAKPGQINTSEIVKSVMPTLGRLMNPYDVAANRSVFITSILINPNDVMTIGWQKAGGGSLSGSDTFGNEVKSIVNGASPSAPGDPGDAAAFPGNEAVAENLKELPTPQPGGNRNVIVAEAFFKYQPLLSTLLSDVTSAIPSSGGLSGFTIPERIYVKRTYFLPRKGNLEVLPSGGF